MKTYLSQLETETFVTEREWTVEGVPVLTAAVSLPQPTSAEHHAARRIRRYYQLQARSYLRYCERWLLPQARTEYHAALAASAPLPCFRAELTYQVTYNQDHLWSLYTQSREVTLPGQTLLVRRGDTWDLAAGYPVPLSAFFVRDAHWKRRLLDLAAEEIARQEQVGISRYHGGWRRQLRRCFNTQNFYLTSEGLAYFFPMYAIAPAAEGIPTFLLPFWDGAPTSPALREKKAPPQRAALHKGQLTS